jgi:hypothetical protein
MCRHGLDDRQAGVVCGSRCPRLLLRDHVLGDQLRGEAADRVSSRPNMFRYSEMLTRDSMCLRMSWTSSRPT